MKAKLVQKQIHSTTGTYIANAHEKAYIGGAGAGAGAGGAGAGAGNGAGPVAGAGL